MTKLLKLGQVNSLAALFLLLILLFVGAVPGYLNGKWQWQQPPAIVTLKQLRELRNTGLNIPGWETVEQQEQAIGGRKWSIQTLKQGNEKTQAVLLLLPQAGPRDQPQVEWTELKGSQHWSIAQFQTVNFNIPNLPGQVKANLFRGSTQQQSFAVMQWYATANGGDPEPLSWFVDDQKAQWHDQRVPWVAVCIVMPMEPFGKVETRRSRIQSLGQAVQTALVTNKYLQ